jgi:hypothetical protein
MGREAKKGTKRASSTPFSLPQFFFSSFVCLVLSGGGTRHGFIPPTPHFSGTKPCGTVVRPPRHNHTNLAVEGNGENEKVKGLYPKRRKVWGGGVQKKGTARICQTALHRWFFSSVTRRRKLLKKKRIKDAMIIVSKSALIFFFCEIGKLGFEKTKSMLNTTRRSMKWDILGTLWLYQGSFEKEKYTVYSIQREKCLEPDLTCHAAATGERRQPATSELKRVFE